MTGFWRSCMGLGVCSLAFTGLGCASGGGGGGGGGGGSRPVDDDSVAFPVDTGDAGDVEVIEDQEAESTASADLGAAAPDNTIDGSVSISAANLTFAPAGTGRQADITLHIAPAGSQDPCADEFAVFSFTATEDDQGVISITSGSGQADLSGEILDAVAANDFVFCLQVTANFAGTVTVDVIDVSLTGEPDDPPPTGNFFSCTASEDQALQVEFGDPGTTKVILSTLGYGRHMLLDPNWPLTYEFDQPVRTCAAIADHFTLTDSASGAEIPLSDSDLTHLHLLDQDGVVVRSRITIDLPDSLVAGNDYTLTLSAFGLSLDGEFQVNSGSSMAANGTLPSGDDVPGGDFVQHMRGVTIAPYLTGTPAAGGMDFDAQGNLLIVGETGLYGPFSSGGAITEGSRLAPELPTLSSRNVVATNDGTVIVKGRSDGEIFEVNLATGSAQLVAVANDLNSFPKSSVKAPAGYTSAEFAGVQAGDTVFGDDSGVTVLDLIGGTGLKGGVRLLERNDINSAFLHMWAPPVEAGKPGAIYSSYKPEEFGQGFQIHRILPNGIQDRFVLPKPLPEVDGTAATHLQDVQGRREFLFLGSLDTSLADTRQLLPDTFTGIGVFAYDATRDRIQVVAPLAIKEFAFDFLAYTVVLLTEDYERAYISMPDQTSIMVMEGLANNNADGDWPCDSTYDQGLNVDTSDSAAVIASTLGNGYYLLKGAPTVFEYEFDRILPFCNFNAGNVTLTEENTGAELSLADADVKRVLVYSGDQVVNTRVMIDLPSSMTAGTAYRLELSGSGFGLPDNFAQVFQLVEANNYLTETRHATGIAMDDASRMFVANQTQPYGPFTGPAEVTEADALGMPGIISGGGRPIAVDVTGDLIAAARDSTFRVVTIDPDTGATDTLIGNIGGSFEVDLVVAPTGYSGSAASAGDVVVCGLRFSSVGDLVAGTGSTGELYNTPFGEEFRNVFVPPSGLFGPTIYGSVATFENFSMQQISADGEVTPLFAPLDGVSGVGGIRLADRDGNSQYMMLTDFDQSDSTALPTAQVRDDTEAYELLVYNPTTGQIQILGYFSRSVDGATDDFSSNDADPDFAFTNDLDTVYLTQPRLRTVIALEGLAP